MFQINYGFVRGKVATSPELLPQSSSPSIILNLLLKSCRKNFNCYLLITDVCTSHSWIFPFTDKKPHIVTVDSFIKKYGKPNRVVLTGIGGELSRSIDFRKTLSMDNFNFQLAAPESSFQIGHTQSLSQHVK